jgi:hypothetical protein
VLVQGEERKVVLHRLLSNDQIRKAGLGDALVDAVAEGAFFHDEV